MILDKFETPFKYVSTDRRIRPLDLLVLHYTASPYSAAHGGSNKKRIRRWMQGKSRKSSTHFTVLRNGEVLQSANLDERTWHSGGSSFTSPQGETLKGINFRSIGLDFDNVGMLYKVGDGFVDSYGKHRLKTKPGSKPNYYQGPEPYKAEDGSYWEPYSIESVQAMGELLASISKEYPIFSEESWRLVGHENIRSTKSDPGPACPMPYLTGTLMDCSFSFY
jgi:N-acetyl-anhydromuramyl-L-alanine amidase AmpD